MKLTAFLMVLGITGIAFAQNASTISVTGKKGEEAVEIRNVTYEVAAGLALRRTEQTRRVIGDKGLEATTIVDAWPLATGGKGKPAYSMKVAGIDGHAMGTELYIVTRGLEEVEWWSLYRIADGKPLFDTHVRPVQILTTGQYAGYEVPEDGDARLKRDERLIGILQIADAKNVVRRVELRCNDTKRAPLLRSYWDSRLTLEYSEAKRALVLAIDAGQPIVTVEIPLTGAAKTPAGITAK